MYYFARKEKKESIMGAIQFKVVNCKNCYKCIRACPVKAISFKNDQAEIIENSCILCGRCIHECPQKAKKVRNDLQNVKNIINDKFDVYVSLAPSFPSLFNTINQFDSDRLFKKLGFRGVEETAVGAAAVTNEYKKLILKKGMVNIISTACPTIVFLIEKYYPQLIKFLAPVVSPMTAHARILKKKYGSQIKTVFVGPCLSKKEECKEKDSVDFVLTFEELRKWLVEEKIRIDKSKFKNTDNQKYLNTRFYPIPGGIIKSLGNIKKYNYKFIKAQGIENCIEIFEELAKGDIKNYFIEANSCLNGCIDGPCLGDNPVSIIKRYERLDRFSSQFLNSKTERAYYGIEMSRSFKDKSHVYKEPSEKEIQNILRKIGKFNKKDELNCGACGYSTCREKAKAVYNGKANLSMCLPYMRERAESISNIIMNATPNAIAAISDDFTIQFMNNSAEKLFKCKNDNVKRNIFDILDCNDIRNVERNKKNILNQKYYYDKYGIIVEQSIIYIKENHIIIIIMKDITKDEESQRELDDTRTQAVDIAQNIIDKQMMIAQEIASLLGETTAETKVALTKLKKSMQKKIGD